MAQAKDYGDQDSTTLVPAGLTVFRHFTMDMQDGRLYPMNMVPVRKGYPFSGMASNRAYATAPQVWTADSPKPGPLVHQAECAKIGRLYYNGNGYSTQPDLEEEVMHQAPVVSCSCGFYAHYDPAEDFYPDRHWGYNFSIANARNELRYHTIVRAACEASGRVVMGRLGVRAAKLRILGIAIDWAKQKKVPYIGAAYDFTPNPLTGFDWRVDLDSGLARYVQGEYVGSYVGGGYGGPQFDPAEDQHTIAAAETVALDYDCRLYGSVDEMHKAHPKEDIEALGVDTTPPPPTSTLSAMIQQQQQLYYYSAAKTTTQRTIIDALFSKPKAEKRRPKKVEPEPKTAFEKALAAKKGRAAAPGSGVDYRKRKL